MRWRTCSTWWLWKRASMSRSTTPAPSKGRPESAASSFEGPSKIRFNWLCPSECSKIEQFVKQRRHTFQWMSLAPFYQHKAEQCDRLAATASDHRRRADLQHEGKLWREIARDIAKRERGQRGPPS